MKLTTREWGKGPRVAVLLHGLTGSSETWGGVAERLNQQGYRCIAPDLRGHGESPKPARGYRLADFVADLAQTLPAEPELLIGHSFGGLVALCAATSAALRPGRMVLEDPMVVHHTAERGDHIFRTMYEVQFRMLEQDSLLPVLQSAAPRLSTEALERQLRARRLVSEGAVRQILVENEIDALELVKRLKTRTLFVLADPSILIPPQAAIGIEQLLGPGSVVTIPHTSHQVHGDDLDGFMGAVEAFLKGA